MANCYFHPVHGPHEGDPIGGAESSIITHEQFAELNAQWHPSLPAAVPVSVTRRQGKRALLAAGLLDEVEAAIDAITDPTIKRIAQIDWADAQEFRRDWELLNTLAAQMGMTDAQIDELFILAATL